MLNQRYSKARQNPRAHPTGSSSATSPTVENNSERDEEPRWAQLTNSRRLSSLVSNKKSSTVLAISALRSPSVAPAPKSLLPAAVVVKTGHPLLASATVETLPASAAVETLPASAAVDTIPGDAPATIISGDMRSGEGETVTHWICRMRSMACVYSPQELVVRSSLFLVLVALFMAVHNQIKEENLVLCSQIPLSYNSNLQSLLIWNVELLFLDGDISEESWDILSMRAWRNFLGGPMPHLAFTVKAAQMQPMSSNVTSNVK
nr:hypothetical protein Iba_chr01dCG2630 [Ipomoea batatas]